MPRQWRARCWIPAVLLLWVPGHLGAQFEVGGGQRANTAYLDISIEAATHLRTAGSYVADRNWPEALAVFERLIDGFADKVVQVGSSSVYVSVRDYCHMQIASMPDEARALYRKRVDAQAESWYRAGLAQRDPELLRRVVDRAFVSSWGDDALDALAELALEAGRFDEAHSLWQRIDTAQASAAASGGRQPSEGAAGQTRGIDVVARGADAPRSPVTARDERLGPRLNYPDTDLDRALVEAKKILCHLFAGERELAAREIAEFRQRFAGARGTLGGVTGPLADRLAAIARESVQSAPADDELWTTFAGNARRSKIVPHAVDIGSVQWFVPLPQTIRAQPPLVRSNPVAMSEEVLSYYPIALRDLVLVCGREEVWAYDLHEGPKEGNRPAWPPFRLRDFQGAMPPVAVRSAWGAPQHTLTADRGRLYVRLGAPETSGSMRRGYQPDSYIVCLDLPAEGKEIWRIPPDEPDLAFEGSPIVADGNLYVGMTRGGAMTHAFVACYDAATGAKKWRQLICEASSGGFALQGTISHNLVTLGAGMVFYNTNLGAIAALDQRTGRVRWIRTYEREDTMFSRGGSGARDIGACLYHQGMVIVTPTDAQGIYALDALTGELRWRRTDPPRLLHLLGVTHGNLIATGSHAVAIDIATGQRVWQWPEGSGVAPYGRGILAGDYVYFPTKTEIRILDQRTGLDARPAVDLARHGQSAGNLAIGDGYLVVAGAKSLTVFCQYEVLINRYRDLIAQNPDSAEPHFRLARAAEATGAPELAVRHYRAAIELSRPGETIDGRVLRQDAQALLYALLGQLGRKAAESEQWAKAEQYFREAADAAPTDQAKLEALVRVAELWTAAENAAKALAAYQQLLANDTLRGLTIQVDSSRSVRADVEIAGRVQALVERSGRDIYRPFDDAARELFEQAQQGGELSLVHRLLRNYPNSTLVTQALLYLATQHAANNQLALAAAAYKQLLARAQNPADVQLAALDGLAQVQESQHAWPAARLTWERLAQEFADAPLPSRPEQSVASFVTEHLSRPPYETINKRDGERLRLPLARRWTRLWGEKSRVLVPDGTHPLEHGMVLLVSSPGSLECVAAKSGDAVWQAAVKGPVRWSAFHGEHLLVGTDLQLVALDARGELLWRHDVKASDSSAAPFGQVVPPDNRPAARSRIAGADLPAFSEFTLVDGRVFLREGSRRLICVSADSGAEHGSYTPTEATVLPRSYFSGQHVAVRTRAADKGGKFVVLDGDGRRRFELAGPAEPWAHPPMALDSNRLCIAADARTIQLMDLTDGRPIWSFESFSRSVQPIAGPGWVLALVGGTDLVRLHPDTGQRLWSRPVSDDPLSDLPNTWAVDGLTFYCITRELNLRAFRLKDGELLWQQPLVGPGDQWQVAVRAGYVVALSRQPESPDGLPVVFCRQSDGRLVQRLVLRPRGSETILHLTPELALVGSEREVWVLAQGD